ncbi:hypothetical protein LguiA_022746 [Lonicera macranthoides]
MWWSFTGETRSLEEKGVQRGTKVERGVERVNEKKLGKVFGPCDARASYEIKVEGTGGLSAVPPGWELLSSFKTSLVAYPTRRGDFYVSGIGWEYEPRYPSVIDIKTCGRQMKMKEKQRQQSGELNVLDWLRAMFGFQAYFLLRSLAIVEWGYSKHDTLLLKHHPTVPKPLVLQPYYQKALKALDQEKPLVSLVLIPCHIQTLSHVQVTSGDLWPLSPPKGVLPRWFSQQPLVSYSAPFQASPSKMYARTLRGPRSCVLYNPIITIKNPTPIFIAPSNPSISYNPDPTIGASSTTTQMDMYPIIPENQTINHLALFFKYLAKPPQIEDTLIQSFEFTSNDPFVQFEELFATNPVPPNQNEPPPQPEVVHLNDDDESMENIHIPKYEVSRHNENKQQNQLSVDRVNPVSVARRQGCLEIPSPATFASWKPRHSRYCYPWKQYVHLGVVLQHLGYTAFVLHGCLESHIQPLSYLGGDELECHLFVLAYYYKALFGNQESPIDTNLYRIPEERQLETLGAQRAGLEDMLKEMKRKPPSLDSLPSLDLATSSRQSRPSLSPESTRPSLLQRLVRVDCESRRGGRVVPRVLCVRWTSQLGYKLTRKRQMSHLLGCDAINEFKSERSNETHVIKANIGMDYVFKCIEKANHAVTAVKTYYITFKDTSAARSDLGNTFQAMVHRGVADTEVMKCRIKSGTKLNSSDVDPEKVGEEKEDVDEEEENLEEDGDSEIEEEEEDYVLEKLRKFGEW